MISAKIDHLIVPPAASLTDVLAAIDATALGFVMVVGEKCELLGTITDGDVRRALLSESEVALEALDLMNTRPVIVPAGLSEDQQQLFLEHNQITFAPIVNDANELCDVVISEHLPGANINNIVVVLMAGGLGSRLGDLTREMPKPMLKVGGEPILQKLIKNFRQEGFKRFVICVKYKADIIKDHFGDGRELNVDIQYVEEKKRLGTGGALSLIDASTADHFIVANADVYCTTSYQKLLKFHIEQGVSATMAVREHVMDVPYGVVETEGFSIKKIREKPRYRHFINAGYYVLEANILKKIPVDTYFDLPSLFELLHEENTQTRVFPTSGEWIDIGRPEDLAAARNETLTD